MGPDPWARALLADGGGGDGGGKRPAGADPAPTTPAQTRPHNFKNVSLVGGRGCPHGIFYPCERWRGRGAGPAGCAPPPPLLSPGLGRPKRVLGSPFFCDPQTLRGVPQIQGQVLWWENACGLLPLRKSSFSFVWKRGIYMGSIKTQKGYRK